MDVIPKSNLKIVLGRDSVVRRSRSEKSLIDYILTANRELSYSRLKSVLCWFEDMYKRNKSVKGRVTPFLKRLARACLEENRFDLYLRSLEHMMANQTRITREQDMLEYQLYGFQTVEQHEYYALAWFVVEAQRAYGETGDVAAQYALALLERIHRLTLAGWDEVISKFGTEIRDGVPSLSMEELADLIDRSVIEEATTVMLHIRGSFECPPESRDFPTKSWLERLFERSEEAVIASILEAISSVTRMGASAHEKTWIGELPDHLADVLENETFLSMAFPDKSTSKNDIDWKEKLSQPPTIILGERHYQLSEKYGRESRERASRAIEEGERIIRSFEQEILLLDARMDRMIEEIRERPRRGLRPGGLDHVEITLTPLRNAGVRALIFHPEGHTFPDVGIEIVFVKETPHLLTYRTTLETIDSIPWKELYHNERHPECEERLHSILWYVAQDVLHRLVTEIRPLRSHPARKSGKHDGKEGTVVRPYLRTLPPGHRASQLAAQAAEESMGWRLPSGMTFVKAFYRNAELHYQMPSEPFAIYGNEDIFSDLKGDE